ncbi:Hypothetical protein NGAL_HAMBI1146_59990 [Neorhizobium galegae bv. officinalis]|nr:Hypothetical protein NGAL_HAMBI1146_59990 [Neorhizobium galegae bv. officinalis]
MRPFSVGVYLSLTYAITAAYERVGGVTKFAGKTRPKLSTLSKYGSTGRDNSETVMPIDVAVDLDKAIGQPIVTAKMAEILGYDLVPKITVTRVARRLSEGDALDVMSEAMDFARALRDAISDGQVCRTDRMRIEREWFDLKHEIDEALINAGVLTTC